MLAFFPELQVEEVNVFVYFYKPCILIITSIHEIYQSIYLSIYVDR